jgi:carbohydrate binding protein with CBM6 domain/Big-like domain-containing protein
MSKTNSLNSSIFQKIKSKQDVSVIVLRLIALPVLLLVFLLSSNISHGQVIVETFEGGSWGGLAPTSGATIKSSYTNAVASSATAANQTITSWNGAAAASTTTVINGEPIASSYIWGYFSASTVSTAASNSSVRQTRSATHGITLADNAGYLITPVISGGITTVTFWMSNGSGVNTGVYVGLNTNTSNTTAYPTYAIWNRTAPNQAGGVYTQFPLQTSFFSANGGGYPASALSFQYTISGTNTNAPGQIVFFADGSNNDFDYPIIDDITVYSAIPFTGTAQAIPGTIKPQNYDLGGQGYSYNDNDATNNGGQYRLGEGVDIETATGDGTNAYDIGWTNSGEWMDYTVNVSTTGTYNLAARVSNGTSGSTSFDIRIDGTSIVGGTLTVPSTGNWQTWETVNATTPSISGGTHKLRIYFTNGSMNLNYLTFTASAAISTGTISGSTFCPGAAVSVPYTATGFNGGNVFTAQLSNSTGSFSSPTNIGTLTSTSSGTISATIPAGTSGTGYLVRIIGSNPSTTGSTSSSVLTINPPTPSFTVSPASTICKGTSVTYTTQSGQSAYAWNVPGTVGTDYTITSGGIGSTSNTVTLTWLTTGSKTVTVNYQNSNGCTGATAASSTTTVNPLPTIMGTLNVCVGLTTTLSGSGTAASTNPWVSATPSVATVSNTGVVTGVSSGTSVITYTDNNGCTSTATVTVNALPIISSSPSAATQTLYLNGSSTALSVVVSPVGGPFSYQWYVSTSGAPGSATAISGANASTYSPLTTTAGTLYYYVIVSNSAGCPATSAMSGAITVSGLSAAWLLNGNGGTTPGTNFMGTTDDKDVIFKRNGVQAGLLNGALASTSFGVNALNAVSTGALNTAFGVNALSQNTSGYQNTAVGVNALQVNSTGIDNVAVGDQAGAVNTVGSSNTLVGTSAGGNITSSGNTLVGACAGCGISTGGSNTIIGPVPAGVPLPSTLSNTVILADGNGDYRLYVDNNGHAGFGGFTPSSLPTATLEVKSNVTCASGLKLTNLTNACTPVTTNTNTNALGVDASGNVVLVPGTVISAGANTTVAGAGTTTSPYVISAATGTNGWALAGNTATSSSTNYVGTTDANDFIIKTNGGNSNYSNNLGSQITDGSNIAIQIGGTQTGGYNTSGMVTINPNGKSAGYLHIFQIGYPGGFNYIDNSGTWHTAALTATYGADMGVGPLVASGGPLYIGGTSGNNTIFRNHSANDLVVQGATGDVTIGTATDDPSAILNLSSATQGFLAPRIPTSGFSNIITPANGLLAYDNTLNVFKYYNGTTWNTLSSSGTSTIGNTPWLTSGNAGTTPGTNFIGTSDDEDLIFKRNNVQSGIINSSLLATGFGVSVLAVNTGGYNTGLGGYALAQNTTGAYNTASGEDALGHNTTGNYNAAFGLTALAHSVTGTGNTALGAYTMYNANSGNSNVAIGRDGLYYNASGSNNVGIGYQAAYLTSSGNNNTALGFQALYSNTTGSNNIAIGYGAQPADGISNGQLSIQNIIFGTNNTGTGSTLSTGNIGIGTVAPSQKLEVNGNVLVDNQLFVGTVDPTTTTGYLLAVNGAAIFTMVKVKLNTAWPDYVFGDDYSLPSLAEVEKYIKENKHLPDMPSADEMKKQGIDLGDNQAALLKKVEELTLYIIDQNKQTEEQDQKIEDLNAKITDQATQLQELRDEVNELKQLIQKTK